MCDAGVACYFHVGGMIVGFICGVCLCDLSWCDFVFMSSWNQLPLLKPFCYGFWESQAVISLVFPQFVFWTMAAMKKAMKKAAAHHAAPAAHPAMKKAMKAKAMKAMKKWRLVYWSWSPKRLKTSWDEQFKHCETISGFWEVHQAFWCSLICKQKPSL